MPLRDEVFDDYRRSNGLLDGLSGTITETLRDRPGTFAAMVTFVALFGFVASNALWHQPNSHENAFYSTRDNMTVSTAAPKSKATEFTQNANPLPLPEPVAADPTVMGVQATLRDLRLYDGVVDGVMGSKTRQAIAAYQDILRMPQTGEISDQLLANLRTVPNRNVDGVADQSNGALAADQNSNGLQEGDIVASIYPSPRPDIENIAEQPIVAEAKSDDAGDPMVKQIQAGLRQFLALELEADGQMGSKTRKAIEDFQNIMQLPVTGKIDDAFLDKMRSEGLIN